jgi:hypothetical protein
MSPPKAETAVVRFADAGFEQRWNRGNATRLETAETHDLSLPYSYRGGRCATGLFTGGRSTAGDRPRRSLSAR